MLMDWIYITYPYDVSNFAISNKMIHPTDESWICGSQDVFSHLLTKAIFSLENSYVSIHIYSYVYIEGEAI